LRRTSHFLLTLAAVASLSGCDILENIPRTPEDIRRAASPFGIATRELVEETPEGNIYRLMVQSRRAASWVQADYAMWEELRHLCPDGEGFEYLTKEPAADGSREDDRKDWPADTLFVRTLRCAPKPAFEFELEGNLTHDEAYALMVRKLHDAAPDAKGGHVVQVVMFSPLTPKYQQIEERYGQMLHARLPGCPSGVVVSHPHIGMFPTSEAAANRNRPDGYLGFVIQCADSAATTVAPAPAAGG
jgi:hypothetical protein